MSILAIIARYNEDINWVKELEIPYLIVNKGDPITDPDLIPYIIEMENSVNGREAHTMLWYIIENYESLPDKLIFLQGNPFDHQPQIIPLLSPTSVADMPDFLPLTLQYNDNTPPRVIKRRYAKRYYNIPIYTGSFGENLHDVKPNWVDNGLISWVLPMLNTYMDTVYPNTDISLREKIYKFLEIPYTKNVPTEHFYGAMFHVKKELILKRPKEYYIRLKKLCEKNMEVVYILEQMWLELFRTDPIVTEDSSD
jgi:hypothetical protein